MRQRRRESSLYSTRLTPAHRSQFITASTSNIRFESFFLTLGACFVSICRVGGQARHPRTGGNGAKSASHRVGTVDGTVANNMSAVDRELALLEQSNAALFAALAQTRAMPASRLPPALDGEREMPCQGGRGGQARGRDGREMGLGGGFRL